MAPEPNNGRTQLTYARTAIYGMVAVVVVVCLINLAFSIIAIMFAENADVSVATLRGFAGACLALALLTIGGAIGITIFISNRLNQVRDVIPYTPLVSAPVTATPTVTNPSINQTVVTPVQSNQPQTTYTSTFASPYGPSAFGAF